MLEIGAGTGGTTWSVLNAFDGLYDSCTFTDVSPAFFPAAGEKFAGFERVWYRTLSIKEDLGPQGFVPHAYDVVIDANMLLEATGTQSMIGFLFGWLPGWGRSTESGRRFGPTIPTLEWQCLLSRTGFSGSGAGTVLHDSHDESGHVTSCIVSQAVDPDLLRLRSPLDFTTPADLPDTP